MPVVFAPGIVSLPGRYEWCLTFSPRLDDCVFGTTNSAWNNLNLRYMKMGSDSAWTDPVPAPFQGFGNERGSSLTNDGTLYFSSDRAGGLGGGDNYRTVAMPGGEITVENLGAPLNSAQNDGSACIARDESYLLFESDADKTV